MTPASLPPDAENRVNPYRYDSINGPRRIAWDEGFAAGRAAASPDPPDLPALDEGPLAHLLDPPAASPDPPEPTTPEVIMDANGNYWRRYEDGSLSICPTSTDNLPLAEPIVIYRPDLGVWPDQSAQHGVLLDQIRELHRDNERPPAASPDKRLREAGERLAQAVARVCGEGHPALGMWRVALAAADREAPDEPKETTDA